MNVENLLSHGAPRPQPSDHPSGDTQQEAQRSHQYPTRHSIVSGNAHLDGQRLGNRQVSPPYQMHPQDISSAYNVSPTKVDPKNITFELLFTEDPRFRARLPMKVQIWRHDNTDNIVSAVKNFFGLYDVAVKGVSFEDAYGNTLIASYENFASGMTVYVRVIPDLSQMWQTGDQAPAYSGTPVSAQKAPRLDEGFQMPPPNPAQTLNHAQQISRPASRIARKQSASPYFDSGRRSASVQKGRPRASLKSRENSFQARLDELNSDNMKGYNSSDGEGASVTSSFKARNEQLASAEISVENIVEGGRRQKAKFESSELPLFVPPQIPAANSTSSISPQRRSNGHDNASPFARPPQRTFSWSQPLQSPQNPTYGIIGPSNNTGSRAPAAPHGHRLRDRVNAPTMTAHLRGGMAPRGQGLGILPTPDPTIASTISDEDVALQLMRLGDPTNMSHGRTSASTMDDALSGRADIASSATSDSEEDREDDQQHAHGRVKANVELIMQHSKDQKQRSVMASSHASDDDFGNELENGSRPNKRQKLASSNTSQTKVRTIGPHKKGARSSKYPNDGLSKKAKTSYTSGAAKVHISPAPLPPQSRKTSFASTMGPPQLPFADDDDLSTKPRCQRCRKSKKGCDRQRPCQRCKDAGIGAEGCISEDEGNGRKGRFGRHMGVSIQKDVATVAASLETEEAGAILDGMATGQEKSKKRKR
ncbi:MAG: hypothetical protein Q9217_002891 [Psora testacea]